MAAEPELKRQFSWVRIAALSVASAGLIYAVLAVGIANITETSAPHLALRFNPTHAKALSAAAFKELEQSDDPTSADRAKSLAEKAIIRDPTSAPAVRTLGLIATARGDDERALALMNYSMALGRRDLPTHLWMIEKYVADDNLHKALEHYDMALRTSKLGNSILMPILVQATEDARIIGPLAGILGKRPPWADAFIKDMIASGPSSENTARLAMMLARTEAPFDLYERRQLVDRLIADEHFKTAGVLMGRDPTGPAVVNGEFQESRAASPFSWDFQSGYDFGGDRRLKGGSDQDFVLSIFASPEKGGQVARQFLLLEPGRYRLSSVASGVLEDPLSRPFWLVSCATATGQELLRLDLADSQGRTRTSSDVFSVPASGCGGQWLRLQLRGPTGQNALEAEVEKVAITPIN